VREQWSAWAAVWLLSLDGESEYEVLHTSHHRSFVNGLDLFDYTQLDISNRGDVKSLISSFRPDIILNAAAMTNVDLCERDREQAWKINVTGVEHLVEVCRRINAKLIHVSTDYVLTEGWKLQRRRSGQSNQLLW